MKNNNLIGISGKINSGKDTVGNIIQILTALPHLTDTGVKSFLGREIDSPYKIKKFADKLKDIVCILIGCSREQLEDREFKEKELGEEWWYYKPSDTIYPYLEFKQHEDQHHGIAIYKEDLIKLTPRLLLQLLGTEAGRDIIHPNLWVNSLFADYTKRFAGKIFLAYGIGRAVQQHEHPKWCITDMRFHNEFEAVKDRGGITIRVNRDYILTGGPEDPKQQHYSETALDNETRWDYVIDNNSTIEDLIKKVREILNKENII